MAEKEKKEEKREDKNPKVDGKSPAQSKTVRSWIVTAMVAASFIGIAAILLFEVVPPDWMESSSGAVVLVSSQPQSAAGGSEERVKIALLGPDEWSSETFDMVRIPKGKEFFLDCPLGGQVLFSDGESGPCMKEGGYSLKRGIVRFKGGAGDHVTVCWGGKCDPEVRPEVGGDNPPGWNEALEAFQKQKKEEGQTLP